MSLANWFALRKSAVTSVAIGSVTWVVALLVAWKAWPRMDAPADRLAYAVQLLVPVAVLVLLMVSACFRLFDTPKAANPFNNAESDGWKVHQRVLSNTVEQSLIFVPLLLALAARVPPEQARILPILTALWCAGRLLFWIGYRIRPALRVPGFEWSLFSSLAALAWFVASLF